MGVSSIYLMVLGFIGPFVFALALMPGYVNNISTWIARYIQISFWVPMAAIVDFVNFKLKDAMVDEFWRSGIGDQMTFPVHLILLDAILLMTLLAIPTLANWVITSAGASEVSGAMAKNAQKAFTLKRFIK